MHEPPESESLLRYVGLVSSAVAAALFAVALCFPAFLTLAPERYTTLGWEALIGSAGLILLIPGAISMIVTSVLSLCFEGELRAFGGIAEGVAVLLAALANPMFLASCVALAVRWLRTALATSTIALIGMTVSWWVVTKFNVSIVSPPGEPTMRRIEDGYYLWFAAGVVVLLGTCGQWIANARQGERGPRNGSHWGRKPN